MDNDTLTVGVSPDGIKNRTDIRILLCYMLDQFPDPLTRDDLLTLTFEGEYANYFEVSDAIEHLIENEHLMFNEKTGALVLAPPGKRVSDTLSERLPATIRKKTHGAIERLLKRRRSEQSNSFVSAECGDAGFRVDCVIGGKTPDEGLMSLSFTLPTSERVVQARERFFDDPERLYCAVLAHITGDDSLLPKTEPSPSEDHVER